MMTVLNKTYNRIKAFVWRHNRKKLCARKARDLESRAVSILSMNCIGGVLYHDLGLPFLSPTINMFMEAGDFIRFCEHLDDYLAIDSLTECRETEVMQDRSYPVAWLGDIKLFLVHYRSVAEAQEAWNKRKKRIVPGRIVVMATDRDGMNDSLKDRFEKLPYQKVMFVNRPDPNHASCFYLKGYEQEETVGIIMEPIGWRGYRMIDQFDYIRFLNGAAHKENEAG